MSETTKYSGHLWAAAGAWEFEHMDVELAVAFCEGALYIAGAIRDGQNQALDNVLPVETVKTIELEKRINDLVETRDRQDEHLERQRKEKDDLTRRNDALVHQVASLTQRLKVMTEGPTFLDEALLHMVERYKECLMLAMRLREEHGLDALMHPHTLSQLEYIKSVAESIVQNVEKVMDSASIESAVRRMISDRHYVVEVSDIEQTTLTFGMLEDGSTDGPWIDVKHAEECARRRNTRLANRREISPRTRGTKIYVVFSYSPVTGTWIRADKAVTKS